MSRKKGGAVRSVVGAAVLLLVVLGVRAKVGGPLVVQAPTLAPSVAPGDWVWVWKWPGPVSPGDAVWVAWPGTRDTGAYRVVAVGPAEVVVDEHGRASVDGVPLQWQEAADGWSVRLGSTDVPIVPGGGGCAPVQLVEGEVFVLSDARPVGGDSRVHGAIPRSAILGTLAGSSLP